MKTMIQRISIIALVFVVLTGTNLSVFAQEYDMGTAYPTYDMGTAYPTYDMGTAYPTYDMGTAYPTYDMGTAYPTYDMGTAYPTYDTGTSYTPGYSYTPPVYYDSIGYGSIGYGSVGYGYGAGVSWTGYNYTAPSYVAPTYTCPNGTVVNYSYQCPVTPPTYTCSDGTVVNYSYQCPRTPPTYTCPDGTVVNYSYQCPITRVPPVYTPPVYTTPTYNYPIYSGGTQVCWDGAVISVNSICAAQYKVCANGTSIPVYQTCYYGGTSYLPYIPPQTVKFNNVVTSVVTEITNTSARCNGVGLIANRASSTGWFEYGETPNLGRSTTPSSIGSSATAPFSNVLVNLKPTTNYYCRAVMQNQYGIVKGEVVRFTTKSKKVSYVKPVVTTKKITTTKKSVKTNEIICSDGSIIILKSQSSAELINQGQKLIALQMEKTEGEISSGSTVSYKLTYKNLSDSRLTGVDVRISLPQEVSFVSASAGNYDASAHTIILNRYVVDPYTESVVTWTGKVAKDSPIGKSIVTTAYIAYTVPDTSVQDEVTAYVVGTVIPVTDISKSDTGAKKVIGAEGRGFLPDNLVEWLALIAILFIIFILGRSIYASYKEEDKTLI